jgi:hydroxypyruvate isomerase
MPSQELPSHVTQAHSSEPVAGEQNTLLRYSICADAFWLDRPFLERLDLIADAGFSHFEFWKFQAGKRPGADKDIDAIARLCARRSLSVVQFSAGWSLNSAERRAEFLAELDAAVIVAGRLGVKLMTVIAGRELEGVPRAEQIREVIASLAAAAPIAQAAGVTLMLEPTNVLVDHPGQLLSQSAEAAEIISAVNSAHVKMAFDVYHQQISEGNLTGNIKKYQHLIAHYQIADYPGRHEPGTGEINMPHVLRTIHDTGYRGMIGLELFPKADPMRALAAVLAADRAAAALAEPL